MILSANAKRPSPKVDKAEFRLFATSIEARQTPYKFGDTIYGIIYLNLSLLFLLAMRILFHFGVSRLFPALVLTQKSFCCSTMNHIYHSFLLSSVAFEAGPTDAGMTALISWSLTSSKHASTCNDVRMPDPCKTLMSGHRN